MKKQCHQCNNLFGKPYFKSRRAWLTIKYCSVKCKCESQKGFVPKGGFKKGLIPWNKNKSGLMPIPWNKGLLGLPAPHNKGFKKGITPWNKGLKGAQFVPRGSDNWNWKGGLSPLNKRIRNSTEFKQWREQVFKRDDYTCQECKTRGGELHPHHLKPFAYYPELRFMLANGQTLCIDCHKRTDTYGIKAKIKMESVG